MNPYENNEALLRKIVDERVDGKISIYYETTSGRVFTKIPKNLWSGQFSEVKVDVDKDGNFHSVSYPM